MSYQNNDMDNLQSDIMRFLEDHTITELLEIVTDCVERKENVD